MRTEMMQFLKDEAVAAQVFQDKENFAQYTAIARHITELEAQLSDLDELKLDIENALKTIAEYNQENTDLKEQLAAAKKDAELGASINRACRDLPLNYQIEINLEHFSGSICLFNPTYENITPNLEDVDFHERVNICIDKAIAGEAT